MKYKFDIKTYNGTVQAEYDTERLGPLEIKLLENMDPRVKELVYLFLEEGVFEEYGMTTEEELLKYEADCNTADGKVISECSGIGKNGIAISTEQLKRLFSSIWKSHLFVESSMLDFMDMQFHWKLKETVEDPDELLFWTFRFCAWGDYRNYLPYTLYKGLLDGRFAKFYDDYPNESSSFH